MLHLFKGRAASAPDQQGLFPSGFVGPLVSSLFCYSFSDLIEIGVIGSGDFNQVPFPVYLKANKHWDRIDLFCHCLMHWFGSHLVVWITTII